LALLNIEAETMLQLRHNSFTGNPGSASFRIETIWLSENFEFLIAASRGQFAAVC